jgi:serine/threonine protein kinase
MHFHSGKGTGILVCPSACFDLSELMRNISEYLQNQARSFIGGACRFSKETDLMEQNNTKLDVINAWLAIADQIPNEPDHQYHSRIFQLDLGSRILLLSTYSICLSRALKYVHQNNILHKNIKPEDILVDWNGFVILADFGCSVFTSAYASADGQKRYAATEVFQLGTMYTEYSDIFSLGAGFSELETLIRGHTLGKDQSVHLRHLQASSRRIEGRFSDTIGECYEWLQALQIGKRRSSYRNLSNALLMSRS